MLAASERARDEAANARSRSLFVLFVAVKPVLVLVMPPLVGAVKGGLGVVGMVLAEVIDEEEDEEILLVIPGPLN